MVAGVRGWKYSNERVYSNDLTVHYVVIRGAVRMAHVAAHLCMYHITAHICGVLPSEMISSHVPLTRASNARYSISKITIYAEGIISDTWTIIPNGGALHGDFHRVPLVKKKRSPLT